MNAVCEQPASRWRTSAIAASILTIGVVAVEDAACQIPCRYEVAAIIQAPDCPFSGPPPTIGTGISPNGRFVCGYWYQCDTGYNAFLYDSSTRQFTTLPLPAGVVSAQAYGVTDSGLIAGTFTRQVGLQQKYRGFVYDVATTQYTELTPINPDGWCVVNRINASGDVCGYRSVGSPNPVHPTTAFLWSRGSYVDLGLIEGQSTNAVDLNDLDEVVVTVGQSVDPDAQAYIWTSKNLTPLGFVPNGYSSGASAINNHHVVTSGGLVQFNPIVTAGFLYLQGTWTQLMPLTGHAVAGGSDIADNGLVVGQSRPSSGNPDWRACVWRDGQVYNLNTVSNGIPSGCVLERAMSVSENYYIVVSVDTPKSPDVALLTPLPRMAGDTNCDESVNIDDLVAVITTWGPCFGCGADLDGNQVVNIDDLVLVIQHWSN